MSTRCLNCNCDTDDGTAIATEDPRAERLPICDDCAAGAVVDGSVKHWRRNPAKGPKK